MFDQDGGGAITFDEIRAVLGGDDDLNDEVWKAIVDEVDKDGNGEIDYEEFRQMMQ